MTYQENIKKHLCDYKAREFPGLPDGFWISEKKETPLRYILLPEDKYANLIKHYKAEFLKSKFYHKNSKEKIKLHIYFHHLNSSQAMCINFFYPLFNEHQLNLVLEFLGFKEDKVRYETVAFEKESKIDGAINYRPTNFDFYFETDMGKKFYFEIKYTEQDFGKAPKEKKNTTLFDKEHINKFNAVYALHLDAIKPAYQGIHDFLSNYQLLRNVIHAAPDSYVVFVYPKENIKIKLDVEKAINEVVVDGLAQHVRPVEWRKIFDYVRSNIHPSDLREQLNEFEEKYFLYHGAYCQSQNSASEK